MDGKEGIFLIVLLGDVDKPVGIWDNQRKLLCGGRNMVKVKLGLTEILDKTISITKEMLGEDFLGDVHWRGESEIELTFETAKLKHLDVPVLLSKLKEQLPKPISIEITIK